MFDLDRIQEIFATLGRNKMRSFLTCLGVFWGVFILVILVSAGTGFKNSFNENEKNDERTLLLFSSPTQKAYKGYKNQRSWNFDMSDVNILKQKVPEITQISPVLFSHTENLEYKSLKTTNFSVRGIKSNFFELSQLYPKKGRLINYKDELHNKKVCVIGEEVAKFFFKDKDPLGESIKINNLPHYVVGVLKEKNNSINIGSQPEYTLFIPINTAQLIGKRGSEVDAFFIATRKANALEEFKEKVFRVIKEQHSIAPNDEKAIQYIDMESIIKIFDNLFLSFDLLIWLVGIGTLISGVIGISNIMLVSIRERTRDIGVRRAIGAKPKDIVVQIMTESVAITFLSGGTAIILGTLLMAAINANFQGEVFKDGIIPFWNALIALIAIIIGGLCAGLLPTMRAIKIKAIDAIRDE